MPPALLSSAEDIVEYRIEDAEPVEKDAKPGFGERCIHSELYKKFPSVNAVIHSHARDVLPFTINSVPLKASIHTAGFLGMLSVYSLMLPLYLILSMLTIFRP
jgi:ribulose-5-phosphate 4-epimerase/fuculose-1-phosphate aldolase